MVAGLILGGCAGAQAHVAPRLHLAQQAAADETAAPAAKPSASACQQRLTPDRAVFTSLGSISGPGRCGGPDVVSLERIITKGQVAIEITPPATLRCETAEAIVNWVRDDLAARVAKLGASLAAIENFDSFECRGRNRQAGAPLSEHGRANALDIRSLRLKNGQVVRPTDTTVPEDFRVAMRASACARFMTVLGPGSDGFHEDHIHVDLAERSNAYRLCHWEIHEGGAVTAYALQSTSKIPLPRSRPFGEPGDPSRTAHHPAERPH
jgi:hypothetical protein